MRAISFALTTPQFMDGSKTVTRRMGWRNLKPGDRLIACEKAMGLGKGGKRKDLGVIEVIQVERMRLDRMQHGLEWGQLECIREGFPDMTPGQFVRFFCASHKGCNAWSEVTRIEFRRL
jgi:hypothetical protein